MLQDALTFFLFICLHILYSWMCECVCLSLLSFIHVQHICVCLRRVSVTDRGLMAAYVNIFFERIFKELCQNYSKYTWQARRGSLWDDFFPLCSSLTWSGPSFCISLFVSSLDLSFLFLHLLLFSIQFFHPLLFFLKSATFSSSLQFPRLPPRTCHSQHPQTGKYKHAYQLRCSLSTSRSHLENFSLAPTKNTTTPKGEIRVALRAPPKRHGDDISWRMGAGRVANRWFWSGRL